MEVAVYRSSRKIDTYLLVQVEEALSRVPAALFEHFGEAIFSFQFTLGGDRRMPRIDASELDRKLRETGYYLQLPPPAEVIR